MSQNYQIKQYTYEGLREKQGKMFEKTNMQMFYKKYAEEVKKTNKFCGKYDEKQ